MAYLIQSFIKHGDTFVPLEAFEGPIVDPNYIEGAIIWRLGDVELLNKAQWDLIDQLWQYIVDGAIKLRTTGEFETYFPDQPLRLAFKAVGPDRDCVTVGSERYHVSRSELLTSVGDGGAKFFQRMMELLPKYRSTWELYLERIRKELGMSPESKI